MTAGLHGSEVDEGQEQRHVGVLDGSKSKLPDLLCLCTFMICRLDMTLTQPHPWSVRLSRVALAVATAE